MVMSASLRTSLSRLLRVTLVLVASLSLLTGCKSSRGGVKRGGGGSSASVTGYDRKDYAKYVSDPMGKALVSEAQRWIGTRYQYGGNSKSGTDCSGLVMRVYQDVCGVKIPRSTREQVKYCTKVARNKIRPGDLVFFAPVKAEDKVSHVGLYVGEGKMIHASSSRGVMVSGFDTGYWGDRYLTGARIDAAPRAFAAVSKRRGRDDDEPVSVPPAPAPGLEGVPDYPGHTGNAGPDTNNEVINNSPSPESATPSSAPPATSTIDLLDLIINQKVDSIFSSGFAD